MYRSMYGCRLSCRVWRKVVRWAGADVWRLTSVSRQAWRQSIFFWKFFFRFFIKKKNFLWKQGHRVVTSSSRKLYHQSLASPSSRVYPHPTLMMLIILIIPVAFCVDEGVCELTHTKKWVTGKVYTVTKDIWTLTWISTLTWDRVSSEG